MDKDFVLSLPHKLPDLLTHGSISEIANQFGMNRMSISAILHGDWTNEKVVKAALDMLNNDNQKVKETLAFAKYDIVDSTSD